MDKKQKHSPLVSILSYAGQRKITMTSSVILAVLSVFFGMVPYYAISKLLLLFFGDSTGTVQDIILWATIATISMVLKILLYEKSTLLSHKAAFEILKNIRKAITQKLAKSSMRYVQSKSSGEFKHIIIDEVEKMEYPLAHVLPELTSNVLAPIAIITYLFITDWRLGIATLITIVLGFIIYLLMMVGRGDMYEKFVTANAKMNTTVVEYVKGIEVIKAFNQTASSMKRFENSVMGFRDRTLQWYRHCWPFLSGFSVVMTASVSIVLPVGLALYTFDGLSMNALLLSIILCLGLAEPIMKLVEFSDNLISIVDTEKKVSAILEEEDLIQKDEKKTFANHDISFNNVSFAYKEKKVLSNVSFDFKSGTTTALVGASGSGKSTVGRLIARFWEVTSGEVCIGGINVRDVPLNQLADTISYVTQDNFLFDISIAENIRMGKPNATDQEICEAAKKAGCFDFIMSFPKGFDTKVGDAGDMLSGGERQRISIARAIIKDSPVIILDEATAFTDPENEHKIQQSINGLTSGKTLIVIAHRLSTIMHSDNIIVMKQGKNHTQGTHEELLSNSELYREMWKIHIQSMDWSINEEVKV